MAATLVRKILLQVNADDGDTQVKLDRIGAKADELGRKHPELAVRIDTAAASAKVEVLRRELRQLGKPVDIPVNAGGGGGLSGMGYLITAGIVAALAGLPALMAAGGATAGIALGAGLLIGTKKVQGPLYAQFHELTSGLLQVLRIAALPLVKPLGAAFAQVGHWAQQMYPVLRQVFGSLGPLVAPMAKGIESLVAGVLPGFLSLMRAARPAVAAVAQILGQLGTSLGGTFAALIPGIKASSQFISGLSGVLSALLPVVANVADVLAGALGPVMQAIGQQLAPVLAGSIDKILRAVVPLLPGLAGITAQLITLGGNIVAIVAGPLSGLISNLLGLATKVLPTLIGPISQVISWLNNLADAADRVLGFLSHIPGLGWLAPAQSPLAGYSAAPASVLGPSALAGAAAAAAAAGFGSWAAGTTDSGVVPAGSSGPTNAQTTAANTLGQKITAALGSGIRETIPQARAQARTLMADIRKELAAGAITQAQATSLTDSVQKALAAHIASTQAAARKLGESLTSALARQIASSTSAGTMATAVGKLLADVKTAYDSGIITLSQDRALTRWLDGEGSQLERIAARRAYLVQEITAAKQYAASTASSTAGNYGLSNFATSGINGGPVAMGGIIGTLRQDVAQIRRFGGNIRKLAKAGLDKNYLGQLIAMGPVQGGELAEELATSLGDIKTINTLESQITSSSGAIGKLAANIQYEGGKAAGSGFLAELEKQKAALDRAGQAIARALVKEMRKDLGPGGAASTGKVEIRLVGGDKEFRTWLKKIIRVTGGNVQVVGA